MQHFRFNHKNTKFVLSENYGSYQLSVSLRSNTYYYNSADLNEIIDDLNDNDYLSAHALYKVLAKLGEMI